MLTVYTYPHPRPSHAIDLSCTPLQELAESVQDIVHHQKEDTTLWFGYLEGWMLAPHEEVILRKAIRKFQCLVISHVPMAFSHSWKNEIDWVYTERPHGHSDTDNNGSAVHDGREIRYGSVGS
jgi:hypothetical protein